MESDYRSCIDLMRSDDKIEQAEGYRAFRRICLQVASSYSFRDYDLEDVIQDGLIACMGARPYDPSTGYSEKRYYGTIVERSAIARLRHERALIRGGDVGRGSSIDGIEGDIVEDHRLGAMDACDLDVAEATEAFECRLSNLERHSLRSVRGGYTYAEAAEQIERKPKSIDNALYRVRGKADAFLAEREAAGQDR